MQTKLGTSTRIALVSLVIAAGWACSGGNAVSATTAASALSATVATASTASGTLLCAPSDPQIAACSGKAAADVCSLAATDGGSAKAGVCDLTIDGTVLACVPTPPAPQAGLVTACSGLTQGTACTATETDGDMIAGECGLAEGGTTLFCTRVRTPSQVSIAACTSKAAGDACSFTGNGTEADGGPDVETGTCSLGSTGTGPLACEKASDLLPEATAACAGLAAGVSCTLSDHRESVTGTCTTPAAGGAAVCVVACSDLGGSFECAGDQGGGNHGRHH
jgi:hypothetical protein